jgi:hypothetical protein
LVIPHTSFAPTTFVLHKENEAFVRGQRKRLTVPYRNVTGLLIVLLLADARLLLGEVLACTSQQDEDNLTVRVTYRFRAPTGQELQGHDQAHRNDLKHVALPSPATPVVVNYLSPKDYFLL